MRATLAGANFLRAASIKVSVRTAAESRGFSVGGSLFCNRPDCFAVIRTAEKRIPLWRFYGRTRVEFYRATADCEPQKQTVRCERGDERKFAEMRHALAWMGLATTHFYYPQTTAYYKQLLIVATGSKQSGNSVTKDGIYVRTQQSGGAKGRIWLLWYSKGCISIRFVAAAHLHFKNCIVFAPHSPE